MKKSWITYTGAAFGIWAALSLAPSFAEAEGNEADQSLEVNLFSEEEGQSNLIEVKANDLPVVEDVDIKVLNEEDSNNGEESINESQAKSSESLVDVSIEDAVIGIKRMWKF